MKNSNKRNFYGPWTTEPYLGGNLPGADSVEGATLGPL